MINSKYAYKNVTISGLPGNGSTTLLNLLREKLKFDGWTGFSGGEFMRAYALEKGLIDPRNNAHHNAEIYSDQFDLEVDMGMRAKLSSQDGWIIESWLSGFLAQGLPSVLKVLVVCSQDAVRIDRIINRDHITVQEAQKSIVERYQKNWQKWSRMYRQQWQDWVVAKAIFKDNDPIDFWHPKLYDLVIDTFSYNQQQTLNLVLSKLLATKEAV